MTATAQITSILLDPSIPADVATHGGTSCADVEALLAESTNEVDVLTDRIEMYRRADALREAEFDAMREEVNRTRALFNDMRKRLGKAGDETTALSDQIEMLFGELDAAERDAVPAGTLTFAALSTDDVTATYRRISRITRGPVPPSVVTATNEASEEIRQAMLEAGQAVVEQVVRREVRRRRRAQPPSRRVTPPRVRTAGSRRTAT